MGAGAPAAHNRLVLASTSPYRHRLLIDAGIDHVVVAPSFDERGLDDELATLGEDGLALALARGKARSVGSQEGAWILAADQIAVLDGPVGSEMLTKPGTIERAVAQLARMAGREHRLVNGIVLLHPETGRDLSAVDVHVVRMHEYDERAARAYVERHRPLDSVGAYRIEDDDGLIASIEGGD
ncbi:MAG TPA: Maf family protein, partial [Microthrixaceae bacterium]|nr:Maf family protein [Microthrixaceae bacterium]